MTSTTSTQAKDALETITNCLPFGKQHSFMLRAGAGSGKTRALVAAVQQALLINGRLMELSGARIAVITYTRAARDEVQRRLNYDPRVSVSTIHSFAWGLIKPHTSAIKLVRYRTLRERTENLQIKELKGRTGTAASKERIRNIARNNSRIERLPSIKSFQYSPERDVPGRDELSHNDVIEIFAELLNTKPLLSTILVGKFPILFIDEVQDTAKTVVPALLKVEKEHQGNFTLGFFGDTMQRIYLDGVPNLADEVPLDWKKPQITDNHRSASRIVELANSVRKPVDGESQNAQRTNPGAVRIFIAHSSMNRQNVESKVRTRMAAVCNDVQWNVRTSEFSEEQPKTLVLEHSLAASRLGFREFSDCFPRNLNRDDLYGQGATSNPMTIFLGMIIDLASAIAADRLWEADRRIATLRSDSYRYETEEQTEIRRTRDKADPGKLRSAARGFMDLVNSGEEVSLLSLLQHVSEQKLFALPDVVLEILELNDDHQNPSLDAPDSEDTEEQDRGTRSWLEGVKLSWSQFGNYYRYITGRSFMDTQQGVKGLEFPRVMVILDDDEAKGNLFSFNKLLKTVEPSATDRRNAEEGKETAEDRTRRLFYVACTRAKESLAIVYYSADPAAAQDNAVMNTWFRAEEIEVI